MYQRIAELLSRLKKRFDPAAIVIGDAVDPRCGDDLSGRTRGDRGADIYVFGHLGDGNLHYQVRTTKPAAPYDIIYRGVAAAGGGISAEPGIGLDKKEWLRLVRSDTEIAAMRRLKAAFNPRNILSPGRVFELAPSTVA